MTKINNPIFIKNKLEDEIKKVMSVHVGNGKTYNIAWEIYKHITEDRKELMIVYTMSNPLVDNLIKELAEKFLQGKEIKEKIINNIDNQDLKKIGIAKMVKGVIFEEEELKNLKVIVTNHSYDSTTGHTDEYKYNMILIKEYCNKNNKLVIRIYDEVDQYSKAFTEIIKLNHYVSNNLLIKSKHQTFKSDHAFRYCQKKQLLDQKRKLIEKGIYENEYLNDYYYKLPEKCYNMEFVADSENIKVFQERIDGTFNFEKEILNNLEEIEDSKTTECNKTFGKKVGNFVFKRVMETKTYKLKSSDMLTDFSDNPVHRLLSINENILIAEQKIEIYRYENNELLESLGIFNDPNEVIKFVINNKISKQEWEKYYNTLSTEGTELFIKVMILEKKRFIFENSEEYYLTATPDGMEQRGYEIINYPYKKIHGIEKIDIFLIDNKKNSISDIEKIIYSLENVSFKTIAIASKKSSITEFIEENRYNSRLLHVKARDENKSVIIGDDTQKTDANNTNVTITYQYNNLCQGTNHSKHILLIQDMHTKVSIFDRITLYKGKHYIEEYYKSMVKNQKQSTARILRGDYFYKSFIFLTDFDNEDEISAKNELISYIKNDGIEVNIIKIECSNDSRDLQYHINKAIQHIDTSHRAYNNKEEIKISKYTNSKIKNKNEIIWDEYLNMKKTVPNIKDTEIFKILVPKYNVSILTLKRLKASNK